ncbi:hypothetical protein P167DRAFT_496194 [Morchella conica CCBAS932]|uniref:AIG1-type G domain-containing protein n=2 Tax=Morchella sect. Distantes TaxID=1051054 RepID=A0A3N4K9C7_9PEZI|nr:hypothetical protein P167DRAFT_496194 [Morchella conica CCBAS932]
MLLGKTGSGKSSFIKLLGGTNLYTGKEPDVDSGIDSATTKAAPYKCHLNGRPVILIDTPGFDDSARDNIDILEDIVSHLLYLAREDDSFPLHGVIFLHDISEKRFSGSQKKTLSILQQMCGKSAMGNVIVGTTMWYPGSIKRFAEQEKREADILKEHWSRIHSTVRLYEDDVDAAAGILTALLAVPRVNLLVHDEMHKTGGILGETTVGKTIFAEGIDEFERLRRLGKEKEAGVLEGLLKRLKNPADMTFAEKLGLAIAAPIVLAPAAFVAAPVGVIYALVHGANKVFSGGK